MNEEKGFVPINEFYNDGVNESVDLKQDFISWRQRAFIISLHEIKSGEISNVGPNGAGAGQENIEIGERDRRSRSGLRVGCCGVE